MSEPCNITCNSNLPFNPRSQTLTKFLYDKAVCNDDGCQEQYNQACEEQQFGFTAYYRSVYAAFCNPENYKQICGNYLIDHPTVLLQNKTVGFTSEDSALCNLTNSYVPNEDYDEWFLETNVFCGVTSVGMSRHEYDDRLHGKLYGNDSLTRSAFMTEPCKGTQIGIFVFLILLAIVISLSNISVIIVLARDSFYHNSYGLYKFSLALADLLVGIIVLPTLVTIKVNSIFKYKLPFRDYGQLPISTEYLDQTILNMCGFFNIFAFVVSVYTLMASSIDRYLAVRWPIKYKQFVIPVRVMTTILLLLSWCIGVVVGLAPIWKANVRYAFGPAWMVLGVPNDRNATDEFESSRAPSSTGGQSAIALYLTAVSIPLIIVWCVNGMTIWEIAGDECCNCLRRRKKLQSRRPSAFGHEKKKNQSQTFEMRIAKTFLSMTTAFTVALLPIGASIIWLPLADKKLDPTLKSYDPMHTRVWASFDFVAGLCLITNSFHNCIIYTVRSPRFKRNLMELFASVCSLCRSNIRRFRRSSIWSVINEKRKSFSSVTVSTRVHGSVESDGVENDGNQTKYSIPPSPTANSGSAEYSLDSAKSPGISALP